MQRFDERKYADRESMAQYFTRVGIIIMVFASVLIVAFCMACNVRGAKYDTTETEAVATDDPSVSIPVDDIVAIVPPKTTPSKDAQVFDDNPTVNADVTEASDGIATTEATEPNTNSDPELDPIVTGDTLEELLGNRKFSINNSTFNMYDLPSIYYPDINFSYFQPYMSYKSITNPNSAAYQVARASDTYIDENGMLRKPVANGQFSINGMDDYVIALGTYYKEKGTAGSRYLIVTTTGMYTAITGDEKSDAHTDEHHMFTWHGQYAGVIEFLVDIGAMPAAMRSAGTISAGPMEAMKGTILYIYGID